MDKEKPVTIEQTSKPLKMRLAIASITAIVGLVITFVGAMFWKSAGDKDDIRVVVALTLFGAFILFYGVAWMCCVRTAIWWRHG